MHRQQIGECHDPRSAAAGDRKAARRGLHRRTPGRHGHRSVEPAHSAGEPVGLHGFQQEIHRLDVEGARRVGGVRGHEDDLRRKRHVRQHAEPVTARHLHVQEHGVGSQPSDQRGGCGGRSRLADELQAGMPPDQLRHGAPSGGLVIDDDHPQHGTLGAPPRRMAPAGMAPVSMAPVSMVAPRDAAAPRPDPPPAEGRNHAGPDNAAAAASRGWTARCRSRPAAAARPGRRRCAR